MTGRTVRYEQRLEAVAKSRLEILSGYGWDHFLMMCIYRELLALDRSRTHPSDDLLNSLFVDFLAYSLIHWPNY